MIAQKLIADFMQGKVRQLAAEKHRDDGTFSELAKPALGQNVVHPVAVGSGDDGHDMPALADTVFYKDCILQSRDALGQFEHGGFNRVHTRATLRPGSFATRESMCVQVDGERPSRGMTSVSSWSWTSIPTSQ